MLKKLFIVFMNYIFYLLTKIQKTLKPKERPYIISIEGNIGSGK